jgi:hypothetical protein
LSEDLLKWLLGACFLAIAALFGMLVKATKMLLAEKDKRLKDQLEYRRLLDTFDDAGTGEDDES